MLEFRSASARMVNSRRAMAECLEAALGVGQTDCDLVIVYASMGHDYQALAEAARELAPSARILGASCCGVVGSEGVSESLHDVAVMAIRGAEDLAVASVSGINGRTAFERSAELGRRLLAANPAITRAEQLAGVLLLAPGIDINDEQCIAGLESVLGTRVPVFGATSADNMRGIANYQIVDDRVSEDDAWAVGFADPTLSVLTQATHGFIAVGEPLTVTRSEGNRIIELDGIPAWQAYTQRMSLPVGATPGDTIPIGALAEVLPAEQAAEYGNDHILRVVTKCDPDGTMHYPTDAPVGTQLWLTVRDEERIFADMDRMMSLMSQRAAGREIVAVFHADCLARGRFLFNRVMKEELVSRMQYPLSHDGTVPPWLGMYGFGEFAELGGRNVYHNYTTAIYALTRAS